MHKQILLRAAALAGTVSLLGSTLMSVSAEEPTLGSTCSYRYDQIRKTTKDGTDDRRKAMNEFLQACPNYLQGTQRAGAASTSTISAAGTTTTDTIDCADFYRKAVELKQQNPKSPDLKRLEEQYQRNCTGAVSSAALSCEQYQRMLKEVTDTLAKTGDKGKKEGLLKRQDELTAKIASCAPSFPSSVTTEGTTQCKFMKLANGCVTVSCPDLNVTVNSCAGSAASSVVWSSTSTSSSTSSTSSSVASSEQPSSASSASVSSAAVSVSSASRSSVAPKTEFKNFRGIPLKKPARKPRD